MQEKVCTVEWCDRSVHAKGFCGSHYMNHRLGTTPSLPRVYVVKESLEATLDAWGRYDPDTGCLEWTRALSGGYGSVFWEGRAQYVHRLSYSVAVGPIPDGKHIDHKCGNKKCYNPEHLAPVTAHQNSQHRRSSAVVGASGERGVWVQSNGRYTAVASMRGTRHFAGTYATAHEASEAAAQLRKELGFYDPKI